MTAVPIGLKARRPRPHFHDQRHRMCRQPSGGNPPIPADGTKDGSLCNLRCRKPRLERIDRAGISPGMRNRDLASPAFLVGLAAPNGDDEPPPPAAGRIR